MDLWRLATTDVIHTILADAVMRKSIYAHAYTYLSKLMPLIERTHDDADDMIEESFMGIAYYAGHANDSQKAAKRWLSYNKDPDDWNYGNAIHNANMALATIAWDGGKKEEAIKYVLAASKSPGSPQLDSFGPQFPIVPKLLAAGRKDVVLQYLTGVQRFWSESPDELKGWIDQIKKGSVPGDFEWANHVRSL
jgi:hypothetical protein